MQEPPYQRVAILGTGLIGGSLALALRERHLATAVVGISRSVRGASNLCRLGIVDEATDNLRRGVMGADLVIVCSPVGSIAKLATRAAKYLGPDALLTDAGSTKAKLVETISAGLAVLPQPPRFVGSHPLAGDHRSGPESARADLFEGALAVVTPTSATQAVAIEAATALWERVGCQVEQMPPERHDQLLARTSHLPHVAAAALAAVTPVEALRLASTGWADTTRVAAGEVRLWRDILLANRQPVTEGIQAIESELRAYREAIEASDGAAIERLLEQGRQRRDALGG